MIVAVILGSDTNVTLYVPDPPERSKFTPGLLAVPTTVALDGITTNAAVDVPPGQLAGTVAVAVALVVPSVTTMCAVVGYVVAPSPASRCNVTVRSVTVTLTRG